MSKRSFVQTVLLAIGLIYLLRNFMYMLMTVFAAYQNFSATNPGDSFDVVPFFAVNIISIFIGILLIIFSGGIARLLIRTDEELAITVENKDILTACIYIFLGLTLMESFSELLNDFFRYFQSNRLSQNQQNLFNLPDSILIKSNMLENVVMTIVSVIGIVKAPVISAKLFEFKSK